jgi:hypothetical protein
MKTKTKNLLLGIAIGMGFSVATIAQNVPNYVPTNGLVGWWPFNGNANDESGNNNNGTVNGATLIADRFGNANKAYSFDGVNDNITLASVNISNEITLGYWLKIPQTGGGSAIVQNNPNPPYNTTFQCSNTSTNYQQYLLYSNTCNNSQNCWANSSSLIADQWTYLVYTIDLNSDVKLYMNGNLIGTYNGINFTNCANLSNNLRFGGVWINSDPQWFDGLLDDIGIWNRALTQQEITDLYNGNICYQHITVTDTLIINTNLVGFNPVTYQNSIKIFPNPTNDHITINYGNYATLNNYQLRITNSLGQQMFQTTINQQSSYINLSNWTGNGIYFVHLIDPQGNTIDIRKIVLQ